jgi:hypothetical protein
MADRPCRPGEDLKRLWRTLLPGTPFPACGVPQQAKDSAVDSTAAQQEGDAAAPSGKRDAVAP